MQIDEHERGKRERERNCLNTTQKGGRGEGKRKWTSENFGSMYVQGLSGLHQYKIMKETLNTNAELPDNVESTFRKRST